MNTLTGSNALTRRSLVIAGAGLAAVGLTGCSGSSGTTAAAKPVAVATKAADLTAATPGLVGPRCAAYAAAVPNGAGSVHGMGLDPVATAASHNPLLSTLTLAISGKLNTKVNLVDTLNGGQFTVFAPVNDAFKKLPLKTVSTLEMSKNSAALIKILTYHVIVGQLSPTRLVGSQKTVEGGMVKITGSGNTLKVNGASVICGGVKTANATVYLIDSVLTPPAR